MGLVTKNSVKGKLLRAESVPVTDIATQVAPYLDEARHVLKRERGVALAAVQIGVQYRWYVDLLGKVYINPEIFEGEDTVEQIEGCLSLPDCWYTVERHDKVAVRYLNEDGEEEVSRFEGISARMVQHEVDHMNGTLVSDCGDRKYAGE
jgi:peptide deformylase